MLWSRLVAEIRLSEVAPVSSTLYITGTSSLSKENLE